MPWRPCLTLWLASWCNDRGQTQAERLEWIKESASPKRFAERESYAEGVTRFSYRLRDENEDGHVESLAAYVLNEEGHLQMSIYFDDPADEAMARMLAESVAERKQA